jgi:hypothetical protein
MGQWDQVVGRAIRQSEVPEGLCNRLLDTLGLDESSATSEAKSRAVRLPTSAEVPADDAVIRRSRPTKNRAFRVVVGVGASLVAAAILVMVIANRMGSPTPQLTAEFADEVLGWTQVVPRDGWQTDFAASELHGVPFENSIRAIPRRWTSMQTRYASRTIVYDLTPPRGANVYLFGFASAQAKSALPASPPNVPFSTTGGYSIGVWQRGNRVYVLAVRGGERRYRGLIQSSVLLTWWDRSCTNRATDQA